MLGCFNSCQDCCYSKVIDSLFIVFTLNDFKLLEVSLGIRFVLRSIIVNSAKSYTQDFERLFSAGIQEVHHLLETLTAFNDCFHDLTGLLLFFLGHEPLEIVSYVIVFHYRLYQGFLSLGNIEYAECLCLLDLQCKTA